MTIDIIGLLLVLKEGAEVLGYAIEIVNEIQDAIALLELGGEPSYSDLTLEQKTEVLKKCTKIVANLDLNLSCFPLGYETTILFDLDGNPVP